jgi:hypothetical protein
MLMPLIAGLLLAAIAGWLIFADRIKPGEPRNEIEFRAERLGAQFEELEDLGFDLDGPLNWKYVFMHREYGPLADLLRTLRGQGYSLQAIEEIREPENDFVEHKIILSRRERHTQETLAARNLEMINLAARHGVDMYDGSWVVDLNENLEQEELDA